MSAATMTAGAKSARVENIDTAESREDAVHGSMKSTVKDAATNAVAIEQPRAKQSGQFDKRVQYDTRSICGADAPDAIWPETPASPVREHAHHHRHRSGG